MIFVFGSNLAGRHGRGAAFDAVKYWGAKRGVGEGPAGKSYAIPTKGRNLQVLPLSEIETHIRGFLEYANGHPGEIFMLTPVGCGLAGYSRRQIWKVLADAGVPENVVLSSSWVSQ